jgi:hypothetical protein
MNISEDREGKLRKADLPGSHYNRLVWKVLTTADDTAESSDQLTSEESDASSSPASSIEQVSMAQSAMSSELGGRASSSDESYDSEIGNIQHIMFGKNREEDSSTSSA